MAGASDVVYCCSEEYLQVCNLPPKIRGRALYVHKLLDAYGLFSKLRLEEPSYLTQKSLQLFHCKDYITCIQKVQECLAGKEILDDDSDDGSFSEMADLELENHGLEFDCSPFPRIMDYISLVAGASVKCAELLNKRQARVAINLHGGWHHAHRDSAAGFCYVNDIVLAILKLKEEFDRVLYVDMDIHHGDGVEEAFTTTDKVTTVSFHKLEDGYFPGTGKISDIGCGRGKYHTVNVPLKEAINDQQYFDVFSRIMDKIKETYDPNVVVYQCGADVIAGDPLGGFNLTNTGFNKCVKYIAEWELPLLILGGGGYNYVNTARVWTSMMAALLGSEISNDVPEHEYFSDYGPFFDINVTPSIRRSQNSSDYLEEIIKKTTENLENIRRRSPLNCIEPNNNESTLNKAHRAVQEKGYLSSNRRKRNYFQGSHDENDVHKSHVDVAESEHGRTKRTKRLIEAINTNLNTKSIEINEVDGKVLKTNSTFEFDEHF